MCKTFKHDSIYFNSSILFISINQHSNECSHLFIIIVGSDEDDELKNKKSSKNNSSPRNGSGWNDDHTTLDNFADKRKKQLTYSEEQFFDVIRMRTAEVKVAQIRVEKFARRLWFNKDYRNDKQLSKLTNINILSKLCQWFFQSLSKRLIIIDTINEKKGFELLSNSHMMKIKGEILERQNDISLHELNTFENNILTQVWYNKKMLSPIERKDRFLYYEKIKKSYNNIELLYKQSYDLFMLARKTERLGRMMLPRLQLSIFICNNIWLKVAAARTKESLMEKEDIKSIKLALVGPSGVYFIHSIIQSFIHSIY